MREVPHASAWLACKARGNLKYGCPTMKHKIKQDKENMAYKSQILRRQNGQKVQEWDKWN